MKPYLIMYTSTSLHFSSPAAVVTSGALETLCSSRFPQTRAHDNWSKHAFKCLMRLKIWRLTLWIWINTGPVLLGESLVKIVGLCEALFGINQRHMVSDVLGKIITDELLFIRNLLSEHLNTDTRQLRERKYSACHIYLVCFWLNEMIWFCLLVRFVMWNNSSVFGVYIGVYQYLGN